MSIAEPREFPFLDGRPTTLTALRCGIILLGCAAGLTGLLLSPLIAGGRIGQWIGAALLVLLPLLGLWLSVGRAWTRIFHRPTTRDIVIGLVFAPATLLASAGVAIFLQQRGLTSGNPAIELVGRLVESERALFLGATGVQLLGEELITVLPFLVVLTLASRALPRRSAIILAWIVTALMFGAIHLPTYHWHLGQSLLVIGVARLVLTAAYLVTKNIWASFIAHLVNDWSMFAMAIVVATRA